MKKEEYWCKVCNENLEIKDGLLFCSRCNIFMGKKSTFKSAFDPDLVAGKIPYRLGGGILRNKNIFFKYLLIALILGSVLGYFFINPEFDIREFLCAYSICYL